MKHTWWQDEPEADRQALGIIFHRLGDHWTVHRTLLGSPAEVAGVQSGDIVQELSGRPIEASLRGATLSAMIELLDSGADHEVLFLRGQARVIKAMRPRVLRDLLELDADRGGATLGYCYSCPNCYPRTSGVSRCSECPGYNCTIG